ncbi:MAG: NifU family protein [Alphaproteobacteria bacterium]|jgi:Fe-S cluster biogenesis protein NfuA|nr:NifU family protein [Alphaproteobacteria bacterium]
MLIQTEPTPNPATLKFLPGRGVMDSGTRDFASYEDAETSPLAAALFSIGDVEGVFFGRDFISVTAPPGVEWRELKPQVLEVLLDHFASGAPLFKSGTAADIFIAPEAIDDSGEDPEVVAQIRDLIDTRVRPAVARDGGDIVYRGFKQGTVFLAMQGACSGCPSSAMTLKQGIESLLKHYVPEVEAVQQV